MREHSLSSDKESTKKEISFQIDDGVNDRDCTHAHGTLGIYDRARFLPSTIYIYNIPKSPNPKTHKPQTPKP